MSNETNNETILSASAQMWKGRAELAESRLEVAMVILERIQRGDLRGGPGKKAEYVLKIPKKEFDEFMSRIQRKN